jgi:hypothetical protein
MLFQLAAPADCAKISRAAKEVIAVAHTRRTRGRKKIFFMPEMLLHFSPKSNVQSLKSK